MVETSPAMTRWVNRVLIIPPIAQAIAIPTLAWERGRFSKIPFAADSAENASAAGRLVANPVVQFRDFRRQGFAEVGHFVNRPDFDFARAGHRIGAALHPLDRLG